jgi:hypothetical protein
MKITMPTAKQFKAMSADQLWDGLDKALKFTEESLRIAAAYWMELLNRGEDMSRLGVPWSEHFPAIAAGRLDPRMILAYGGHSKAVLDLVTDLVPEDQAKIANPRDPIPLVVPDADGGLKTIMRAPDVMKASELRQVLGDGRIRTPDEQRPHVVMPPVRPAAKPEAGKAPEKAEQSNADLDLFNALTPAQRDQVRRYAATRRPPVAFVDLVVRWAVQHGACKETPAPSRGRRSGAANGREAHPE